MSFTKQLSIGTLWATSGSIIAKLLQFVSSILLARIIVPSEYGLVAIAATINGIAEQATAVFLESALVRKTGDIEEYIHTTWVFNVFRYTLLFLGVFFLAPAFALFFRNDSAVPIIQLSAFSFLLIGVRNVAPVHFRRTLQFNKLFSLEVYPLLIYILTALVLGYFLRSAYAFIVAVLTSNIVALIISYVIWPMVPKFFFDRKKFLELFQYSKRIIFKSIVVMVRTNGFSLFIGRFFDVVSLGYYNRAQAFSSQLFDQVSQICWKVFFPAFSGIQNDREKVTRLFITSLKIVFFIVSPFIVGLYLVAADFVTVMLGPVWLPIVQIIQMLCILAFMQIVNTIPAIVLDALGKPRFNSSLSVLEVIVVVITIFPLYYTYGMVGTLFSLCLGQLVIAPFLYSAIIKHIGVESKKLIYIALFSFVTNGIMSLVITLCALYLYQFNNTALFITKIFLGSIIYVVTAFFLDILFDYQLRKNLVIIINSVVKK